LPEVILVVLGSHESRLPSPFSVRAHQDSRKAPSVVLNRRTPFAAGETKETQQRYGIETTATDDFGKQCLLARRMCEADVRFVKVNYSNKAATPRWDQHSNLKKHETHAATTV
jgi:hypothetical protein